MPLQSSLATCGSRAAGVCRSSGTISKQARSPAKVIPLCRPSARCGAMVQRETYMSEHNPARKSFETGARAAREAAESGTEAAEQAAKRAEQSYSTAAEGLRDFNAKLMNMAQANTTAGLNFLAELARAKGPTEAFELWSRHTQTQFQRMT